MFLIKKYKYFFAVSFVPFFLTFCNREKLLNIKCNNFYIDTNDTNKGDSLCAILYKIESPIVLKGFRCIECNVLDLKLNRPEIFRLAFNKQKECILVNNKNDSLYYDKTKRSYKFVRNDSLEGLYSFIRYNDFGFLMGSDLFLVENNERIGSLNLNFGFKRSKSYRDKSIKKTDSLMHINIESWKKSKW